MLNALLQAQALGQSTWYDNISRGALTSGELAELIKQGVTGVTSNPTIFEKAITNGTDYDQVLAKLTQSEKDPARLFENISVEDIQGAADILRSVYDHTDSVDGYVSLEVSPHLAHDIQGTISAARSLFAKLQRPNIMIKIPATPEGISAVRTVIADGINVNVTLIFSLETYAKVMDAFICGLEDRLATGKDLGGIASVASFFVSRVDTIVDSLLTERGTAGDKEADGLKGKAAIAQARKAYTQFRDTFSSARFVKLRARGAQMQRPLWASTGTKNPDYPDTLYVDSLIGPNTVNTMPPATLQAVLNHGQPELTLQTTCEDAEATLQGLKDTGIDMDGVANKLLVDGLRSFSQSYDTLLEAIGAKCTQLEAHHAA
jgi:transaldolase/glucose-6-phosphate isomerase